MTYRNNIEIDYCPDCRGVWLDKGELDKLIDMSTNQNSQPIPAQPTSQAVAQPNYQPQPHYTPQPNYQDNQNYYNNQQPHYKKKKKEGWFGEMFDFD